MNVFGDESDYEIFLVMLAAISKQRGVAVHGYSLMTTHIHFLATPETKTSLPDTMKVLGGQYVKYFNRKYKRAGTLWRHRHRAILIEDERRWLTCLRYNRTESGRGENGSRPSRLPMVQLSGARIGRTLRMACAAPALTWRLGLATRRDRPPTERSAPRR